MNFLHNFTVTVKDDERAFLFRDGRLERLLGPGLFKAWDPMGRLRADVVKVLRAELALDKALLLERAQPALAAEHLVFVRTEPTEVAITLLDGEPRHISAPSTTRAFWKTMSVVEALKVDTATALRVEQRHLELIDFERSTLVAFAVVEAHEAGLLFVDGKLVARSATFRGSDYDLTTDQPLLIGAGPHDSLRGALRDMRIYNRALSADEIAKILRE